MSCDAFGMNGSKMMTTTGKRDLSDVYKNAWLIPAESLSNDQTDAALVSITSVRDCRVDGLQTPLSRGRRLECCFSANMGFCTKGEQ